MRVDVCLVSEGAYPYVTGGTGTWTHQLIQAMPEVRFGLLTILPEAGGQPKDRYEVPPNVVARQAISLAGAMPLRAREPAAELMRTVRELHATPTELRCPYTRALAMAARGKEALNGLLRAKAAWQLISELYRERQRSVSFLDYFWTWKATHGPLFRLLSSATLEADVYHAISTGYAGFVGAIAKLRHGGRLVVTEHGIYTREREIEVAQAEWIHQEPAVGTAYAPRDAFFKEWWLSLYRYLGQAAYDECDRLVSLHDLNRRLQIAAGATADRLEVVPNGIDTESYRPLRGPRDWSDRPFRVGLIGRVVPIKDIMTFLRAAQLACQRVPLEAYVLGPLDEDPDYATECQELVKTLGLEGVVRFEGRVPVREWLPRLDLNVISSVSESQPLAILEAAAAGVPTVATDVGACRLMLGGQVGEDPTIGPSGLVVPVASPEALADAFVRVAGDAELYRRLVAAGIERVERYYQLDACMAYYRTLYRELASRKVA